MKRAPRFSSWLLLGALAVGGPAAPARGASAGQQAVGTPPLLVILTETGETREGVPVLAVHPDAAEAQARLLAGFSGRVIRIYRMARLLLESREGTPVEPAYVLLSTRQGGFARVGFYLGAEDHRASAYVDVHRDSRLSGHLGALDQIVPHEMAHVLRRLLAGELSDEGGANQIHAIGVRTDRVVAFNEGFAEHFEIMALDDPGVLPDTAAARDEPGRLKDVLEQGQRYARELRAALAVATPMRMGILLWFSQAENVLRYHAVKQNLFARQPPVPERLLVRRDLYPAYLLENVMPGPSDGEPRSVARMLSTEGVVSALFHRWATDPVLRATRAEPALYESFGTTAAAVDDLENVYLKLYAVYYESRPQTAVELIDAYRERFPEEAPRIAAILDEVFLGQQFEVPAEVWLASPSLQTGTTIFDQFRGLPRTHTFELNAASLVDLASIPGVTVEQARAIQRSGPYAKVEDLRRVPGLDEELVGRFADAESGMDRLRAEYEQAEAETLSINTILTPFAWRAGWVLVVAALAGGGLYRALRRRLLDRAPGWWRTAAAGLAAALAGMLAGWALAWPLGLGSIAGVLAFPAIPGAVWALVRHRSASTAIAGLATWVVSALPAALLTTPWP